MQIPDGENSDMAIAPPRTQRCNSDEWKELRALVANGMLFEVQDWIASGRPTLRPYDGGSSVIHAAIERENHSMVRVLWEGAWQDADEAADSVRYADNPRILRHLLEAGCPIERITAYQLCLHHDLELIRLGMRRGVNLRGPDGWADAFIDAQSKPLIRFFLEEKDRTPGLKQEGVRALCIAISDSRLRAAALLVWAGVDPFSPCPRSEEWDEPETGWDGFPALYLGRSEKALELLPLLKLRPNPDQWMKMLQDGHFRGPLLETVLAQRVDGPDIIRRRACEASDVLISYFQWLSMASNYGCPDRVSQIAEACSRLIEIGAMFILPKPDGVASARRWIYQTHNAAEVIGILDLAWKRGTDEARNCIRELISKPKPKELVRKYAPDLSKSLGILTEVSPRREP